MSMEGKRYAIIGRELARVAPIRSELAKTYYGLEILCAPFITTRAVPFELPELKGTPLYLFTSPRAVENFFRSASLPLGAFVASIGLSTTKALCSLGIEVHFTSSIENAKGMAPELLHFLHSQSQQFHIIQPSSHIAGRYLYDFFSQQGFQYSCVTTYEVQTNPDLQLQLEALSTTPEWVLFYSPSGVRAWAEVSKERPLAFSIGPVTTAELRQMGWENIFESDTPHEEDILKVITKHY